MSGCRFGSPDLVTSIAGVVATPTFAFSAANANYFGVAGSFTSNNGATCSFPTRSVGAGQTSTYKVTPIIVTTSGGIGRTTTCNLLAPPSIIPTSAASTTYSGIECPSITDNAFAPGTYTLRFSQPAVNGVPTISSRLFIIAAPTTITDRVTSIVSQTVTATGAPTSTTTLTEFTSTATLTPPPGEALTVTETITAAVGTVTVTDFVQSCDTPTTTSSATTPSSTLTVSPNGQCGGTTGQTCQGSVFGNCCSEYGYCGNSDIYCNSGCQSGFGTCNEPTPVSSAAQPTSTVKVSTDGTCGGAEGFVCTGSAFGDCCSAYGWCGSSTGHCGAGCQTPFGTCPGSTPTGTAPPSTSTLKVSLDGACGGTTGQTCQGSEFGSCCSEYGYCGSTSVYCAAGCQTGFGTCTGGTKRSIANPKLHPARFVAARQVQKRVIGGAGPDYTYPPIPHTTVTDGVTQVTTVTAAGGVKTTTVSAITTTTLATAAGGTVTLTVTTGATSTATETVTSTTCSAVV